MVEWLAFVLLAVIAVGGSLGMLLTMSMYRAAIFLMASFVALAGLFILLQADLLAAIQVMMNVGGMLVMLLFMVALMMDPGGEMMWDMKRKMGLPGFSALSMSMPRSPPPAEAARPEDRPRTGGSNTDWTCPMHPEVSAPGPGSCPKCSMDLAPRAALQPEAAPAADTDTDTYACPMHPEVQSSAPGQCPKCGMNLVPREAAQEPSATTYTCPMHPDVQSPTPGKCPKCGMDLVLQAELQAPAPAATTYTCPMHPEVQSSTPGKCPKCSMDLVPQEDPQAVAGPTAYTCPMHPEVRSSTPGKCPKCSMDLVPDESAAPMAGHAGMQHGGEGGMHHGGDGAMPRMSPAAHYKMMVDMAMSTALLPWAIAIGVVSALLLSWVLLRATWPLSPTGPNADDVSVVGELLLSRYMIGFEGAAYLILAGVIGAVLLGKREHRR